MSRKDSNASTFFEITLDDNDSYHHLANSQSKEHRELAKNKLLESQPYLLIRSIKSTATTTGQSESQAFDSMVSEFSKEEKLSLHKKILDYHAEPLVTLSDKISNFQLYSKSLAAIADHHSRGGDVIKYTTDSVCSRLEQIRAKVKNLKKESTKKDVRECVSDIAESLPKILSASRSEMYKTIVARDQAGTSQESKDEQLLQKHISRIAREVLKDAGVEVKRTWKEAFNDLFSRKSERETVKAKMAEAGLDVTKFASSMKQRIEEAKQSAHPQATAARAKDQAGHRR